MKISKRENFKVFYERYKIRFKFSLKEEKIDHFDLFYQSLRKELIFVEKAKERYRKRNEQIPEILEDYNDFLYYSNIFFSHLRKYLFLRTFFQRFWHFRWKNHPPFFKNYLYDKLFSRRKIHNMICYTHYNGFFCSRFVTKRMLKKLTYYKYAKRIANRTKENSGSNSEERSIFFNPYSFSFKNIYYLMVHEKNKNDFYNDVEYYRNIHKFQNFADEKLTYYFFREKEKYVLPYNKELRKFFMLFTKLYKEFTGEKMDWKFYFFNITNFHIKLMKEKSYQVNTLKKSNYAQNFVEIFVVPFYVLSAINFYNAVKRKFEKSLVEIHVKWYDSRSGISVENPIDIFVYTNDHEEVFSFYNNYSHLFDLFSLEEMVILDMNTKKHEVEKTQEKEIWLPFRKIYGKKLFHNKYKYKITFDKIENSKGDSSSKLSNMLKNSFCEAKITENSKSYTIFLNKISKEDTEYLSFIVGGKEKIYNIRIFEKEIIS